MKLLKTGIDGLDEILCGGLVPHNSYLIKGFPGSGKTTIGVQVIINGVLNDQRGLIVTFEERPEKLYRDFLNFGWDLRQFEQDNQLKVISTSPLAARDMLSNPDSLLSRFISEQGIERLLIDSISSFARLESDPIRLREIVHQFINTVITRDITPLFIMEANQFNDQSFSFEEYLTDAVIKVSYHPRGERRRERFIEVIKTRGHRHIEGRHTLRIGNRGIEIFPSCQPMPAGVLQSSLTDEKLTSGIEGLDPLLGGGFPRGSSTLLAGSSGTGKTSFGLQFLTAGARRGQKGMLVVLEENPNHCYTQASSIGIDLPRLEREQFITTLFLSPISVSVDELFARVKQALRSHKVSRIVIDSLSDLLHSITDEDYLKDFISSLVAFFYQNSVSSLMTYDSGNMFGSFTLTHQKIPGLIDNLIFLRYVELEGEIARALSVTKIRGCQHDKGIHEVVTTSSGLSVKQRFEGRGGLMAGTATKSVIEMDEIIDHVSRFDDARKRLRTFKNKGFDSSQR